MTALLRRLTNGTSIYFLQSNKDTWSQGIYLSHISPKPSNLNNSFAKRKYFFYAQKSIKCKALLKY